MRQLTIETERQEDLTKRYFIHDVKSGKNLHDVGFKSESAALDMCKQLGKHIEIEVTL